VKKNSQPGRQTRGGTDSIGSSRDKREEKRGGVVQEITTGESSNRSKDNRDEHAIGQKCPSRMVHRIRFKNI